MRMGEKERGGEKKRKNTKLVNQNSKHNQIVCMQINKRDKTIS